MFRSCTIFIPKEGYAANLQRIIRRVAALRPMPSMQTSAKVIAATAHAGRSSVAHRTVCHQQRGFVLGRQLVDNVIEVAGELVEFAQLQDCLPAIVLLDFAQASPTLAHRWIFVVLQARQPIPPTLDPRPLRQHGYVCGGVCELSAMHVARGMKQGCPLSGSKFVFSANPLTRAYLSTITFWSVHIGVFADDIAHVV